MQSTFDKFYGKTNAELSEVNKELTLKKIRRGFEASLDSFTERKLEIEEEADAIRLSIVRGTVKDIPALATLLVEYEDIEAQERVLQKESNEFTGPKEDIPA